MDTTDFEMHIPGMNFCGPGTNLLDRLEADGVTPKSKSKPIDRVDEAALRHDLFYNTHTSARERCVADAKMIKELREINNPSCCERIERAIAITCLSIKRFFVLTWFALLDKINNNN
jgi:hypothetical protein